MPLFKKEQSSGITTYVPQSLTDERAVSNNEDFANFVKNVKTDSFEIDSRISEQIGLSAAKEKEHQRRFEIEVMKYVQKIKDGAFTEAYDKGYQEGLLKAKEESLVSAQEELKNIIGTLKKSCAQLDSLKKDQYLENEEEIVNFSYLISEKIILRELERDPNFVIPLIKKVIEISSFSENIKVKLSQKDYDFLKSICEKPEFSDLKSLKFEAQENLKPGDVVIETQSGLIEGKLQERLDKIKNVINDNTQYEN